MPMQPRPIAETESVPSCRLGMDIDNYQLPNANSQGNRLRCRSPWELEVGVLEVDVTEALIRSRRRSAHVFVEPLDRAVPREVGRRLVVALGRRVVVEAVHRVLVDVTLVRHAR